MEENIKQYGDLSDKELLDFLNEIEDEDNALADDTQEAAKKVESEEAEALLSEIPENAEIEAYYGSDAWRELNHNNIFLYGSQVSKNIASITKQRLKNLKERRLLIQRTAFNQENINLGDPIPADTLKVLISLLVKEHSKMVDKYEDFINRRLTALLAPFIPKRLRLCWKEYPKSVKASPGFLYRAEDNSIFWAEPKIPVFFEQGTEVSFLRENKPEFLASIDRALSMYFLHKEKRSAKEIKYASTLLRKKVLTYYDLLKVNPFWFDVIYNYLIQKDNDNN